MFHFGSSLCCAIDPMLRPSRGSGGVIIKLGRTRNQGQAPLKQEKTSPEALQQSDPLPLWHQFLDVTVSRRGSSLYSVYPTITASSVIRENMFDWGM